MMPFPPKSIAIMFALNCCFHWSEWFPVVQKQSGCIKHQLWAKHQAKPFKQKFGLSPQCHKTITYICVDDGILWFGRVFFIR